MLRPDFRPLAQQDRLHACLKVILHICGRYQNLLIICYKIANVYLIIFGKNLNTGQPHYLKVQGNGENTLNYSKFDMSKM